MAQLTTSSMVSLRASLAAERTGRAQGAAASRFARFAAVMGRRIGSTLGESPSTPIADALQADDSIADEIRGFRWSVQEWGDQGGDQAGLMHAIESHIRWRFDTCYNSLHESLTHLQEQEGTNPPTGDLASESPESSGPNSDTSDVSDKALQTLIEATDADMDELDRLIQSTISGHVSDKRAKCHEVYKEQIRFISEKARDLGFTVKAIASAEHKLGRLKEDWIMCGKDPLELYSDDSHTTLQSRLASMEKEKSSHEKRLAAFFDHASQGSSGTSQAKPDKVKLVLATDLENRNAGFRQIQLVDLYCLSRANEMWAIIPDIMRVGHDVDPISCMHWRPCADEVSESVKPFRVEQGKAFAMKLLSICTPGQRSELLATRTHGVKKVSVPIDESDGVSIYWSMVQQYHPIGRAHRRSLEKEIMSLPSRFRKGGGNPEEPLKVLREKHQEALDIACRLNWDICAIPLINALITRDALFTVKLEKFFEQPDDPDDSAVEYGELLKAVSSTVAQLNQARKNWDEGSAKVAKPDSRVEALLKEVQSLKSAMAANRGGPKHTPTPTHNGGKKPNVCKVVGCVRTIVGHTSANNWRVCGTCLLQLRGDGKPLKLEDGSLFGQSKKANKTFKAMRAVSKKLAKAASLPSTLVSKGDANPGKTGRKGATGKGKGGAKRKAMAATKTLAITEFGEGDVSDGEPNPKQARRSSARVAYNPADEILWV
jgi:hypothetical protein